jgi:hypothetical protein
LCQAKAAMQPVDFALLPLACPGGSAILGSKLALRILNRHDFISLSPFEFTWEVMVDGVATAQGNLVIPPCEAGESVDVKIEVPACAPATSPFDFSNITSMWSREQPQLNVTNVFSAVDKMLAQAKTNYLKGQCPSACVL